MLDSKGISSVLLIIIITFLGVGFFIGVTSQKSIVSNVSEFFKKQEQPNLSIKPTIEPDVLKKQTETYNAQKPYTTVSDNNKVTFNGVFYIGDIDKAEFTVTLPKKGGEIIGNATGDCTGKITGNMEAPGQDGDAKINGNFEGACKPVPRFSFKTDVKSTFEGTVHLNSGVIDITHQTTEPFSWNGNFNMYFTP